MSDEPAIARLLRWRLALAEAEAPPPPRAALLLAHARRWWEALPERAAAQLERLRRMPLAYGYATTGDGHGRTGHPVPALIARDEDVEAYARVLYLAARDGRVRLQLQLDGGAEPPDPAFDVTFVPAAPEGPLFGGRATRSESGAYWVDVELPPALAHDWAALRVTDPMPFRLMLRPVAAGG